MEPRPQRPRAQAGQSSQTGRHPNADHPGQQRQAYAPGEYPEGADPTSFIAPPRTEYDYSPLDLAPPGQRRRRQFVAAAVGGLTVLLLAAILFFSYLLLRDEDPPSENDDLLAAQTQIANDAATVAANQTIVAQAAAEQTEQAQALNPEATGEPSTEEAAAPDATEETAETPAGDAPSTEEAAAPEATEGSGEQAPDLSGNASLDEAGLTELLPAADVMPEGLTATADSNRTREQVLEALGGSRTAETNLETWGWSGNVERTYTPADPEAVAADATGNIIVSIHGFSSPQGAGEALTFFSDILVDANGYTEGNAPEVGDSSRLLTMTDEEGQTFVALYVQQGSVMYRIGGYSAAGDPTEDVIAVANAIFGG